MTATYSYLATDLVTNKVLGELPVNNVSLDCQLNQPGNMTAGGHLSDPRIDDDEFIARTTPGRTAFWAYREAQIVWGGIILTREYQSDGRALSLTGQTFECYPVKRYPRSAIGTVTQDYNQGQISLINLLWEQLQGAQFGYIGVLPIDPLPAIDTTRQLTIHGYDLATSYNDLIQSIVVLSDGPDYTIAWTEDSLGRPLKQLVVAAPIGNPVGVTDLTIDYPGPIADYIYNENASASANQWWATGDGTGVTIPTGVATDTVALNSGYPLWESVNNYSGVTQQSTINSHASSDLHSLALPLVTHTVDLHGGSFPPFGSYGMGDYVVCNVTDPRFPRGFQFNVRAIGWTIQPPDEAQGPEQITLVFDEPTGTAGS